MEENSYFEPPLEEVNQSFADFNINEIMDNPNLNNEDYKDVEELIYLFEQKKPNNNNNEFISSQFITMCINNEKSMNSDEKLIKKLKKFLKRAYNLICSHNKDNELIEKEKIENDSDDEDKKDKDNEIKFINIIKKLFEKEEVEMEISIKNHKCKFNENYFIINLYEKHEVNMCNDLLKMKIKIKLEIKMSVRSGNVEMSFYYMNIDYNDKTQKIKLLPNLKCKIINSEIGKRGITYCSTCDLNMKESEKCEKCRYRYKFPFDDLLSYLRRQNNISEELKFTYLYFKGANSYKNDSNYKCSFCTDFYAKKANIVRLFCNKEKDPEHTCQFWICRNCFYKKFKYCNSDEVCPNCKKFKINFRNLKSYNKYKNSSSQ